MRLVKDQSAGARAVSVQCIECGRMVRLCDAYIDADGPAFQAYYHPDCWGHKFNRENDLGDSLSAAKAPTMPHDPSLRSDHHTDCDGCDNPDGLPVKRVEYADGSEEWLCTDCRAGMFP